MWLHPHELKLFVLRWLLVRALLVSAVAVVAFFMLWD